MKKSLIVNTILFLTVGASGAEQLSPLACTDCFNFAAPSVVDAELISPAEQGLIVLDTTQSKFRGYTTANGWKTLSPTTDVEAPISVSTTTTLSLSEGTVLADATTASFSINLPTANISGKVFVITKTDATRNTVTVLPYGSETISGSASVILMSQQQITKLISDGTNWHILNEVFKEPSIQRFTSGTGTYFTSPNVKYIRIRMAGGGGGGDSSGSGGFSGSTTNGGDTTFGGILTAGGGSGAGSNSGNGSSGGVGGSYSVGGAAVAISFSPGQNGQGGSSSPTAIYRAGVRGGDNAEFGGAGSGAFTGPGNSGSANTGGGGASGGNNLVANVGIGGGGGGGGYVEAMITTPAASYSYTVGAGGSGRAAGTSGLAGGNGGSGVIIIEEHYQ